jgi:hypothetical protein
MARREFSKSVYAQIAKARHASQWRDCLRSLGPDPGQDPRRPHDRPRVDKSRKLTADGGKLLGAECCHAPKAKVDVAVIAEAKRREAKFHGFSRPKHRQITRLCQIRKGRQAIAE